MTSEIENTSLLSGAAGPGYRLLSHTADTGVEATGDSLASLIVGLATGMFESMALFDPGDHTEELTVTVEAPTVEDLVVDTLSELLYLSESEDLLLGDFRLEVGTGSTAATVKARGVPFSKAEAVGPTVKAVTYHRLHVAQDHRGWRARVYFDV